MSKTIAEIDLVKLLEDMPEDEVLAGDVGVVLLIHEGRQDVPPGYTIEVTAASGETLAVLCIPASLVRRIDADSIHRRDTR